MASALYLFLRLNVQNTDAKRRDVDVKTDKNNISSIVMNPSNKQIAHSIVLLLTLAAIETPASAFQADLTSVDTTFIDGSSTTVGGITYGGDQLRVDTFEANGTTWQSSQPSTLTIRRHTPDPNPNNVDSDFVVWIEQQNATSTDLKSSRPTSTQDALQSNNLYLGTDNVFVNYGNSSDNDSNIERLDYIFDSPVTISNTLGITVFERGTNTSHDSFKIALIIGVDGSNTPTAYSDVINVSSGWGTTNLEIGNPNRSILNDSANPGTLAVSDTTIQDIGGVMFSLDEFTGVNGDIYGYSLFGGDVNSTSPTLTDWTTYPSSAVDTTEGSVGLDPLGVNLGLVQEVPFEFSPSLGLIISGITIGTSQWLRNKHLKKKSF